MSSFLVLLNVDLLFFLRVEVNVANVAAEVRNLYFYILFIKRYIKAWFTHTTY